MGIPSSLRLGAWVGLTLAVGSPGLARSTETRPNVLLIMTDDQGWGDLSSHGNKFLETPNLDRLEAEGVRFDRFFVSPVCAPTRAALLTGRYAMRTGVSGVARGRETMRADEVTLAELLRDAGYATGCFGKWHNGAHYPNHPNGQGFEEFFGFCAGHADDYFDPELERNGKPVHAKGYVTDVLTDAAISFIRKHRDEPFLCYVPYNVPHAPLQVPDREYEKYRSRGLNEETSAIYGMCDNLDANVGRLLRRLDEWKLRERTIVVFLSDNGPSTNRFNGGMKGIKASVDEGSTRVPFFVRWSGHLREGGVIEPIAADIDIVPTLTELCGVPKPEGLSWDGVSLVALLHGRGEGWKERMLFVHQPRGGRPGNGPVAVRTQRYRAVHLGPDFAWELYDMAADPGQGMNIAAKNAGIVGSLADAADAWLADTGSRAGELPPIPVGYPQSPTVELPGTEGFMNGELHYANDLGWSHDWVTGWTSGNEELWWELDVVRGGRYAVTLLYTAPKDAIGTELRVFAGAESCRAKVRKAYDPPTENRPDRDPTAKREVKTFTEMRLGTLKLAPGPVRVALRAVDPTADRLVDVSAMKLRRLGD